MSNGIKEDQVGELTLLCSGMSDSSTENVLSTSIDGGLSSCDIALWGSISILTVSLLGVWGFLEVLTSTGTYLVPQECP